MSQKKVGPMLGVKLTPETLSEIERIAAKRDMTKSDVTRMCLDVGLMLHKDLERVGLIQLMDGTQSFFRWFRETMKRGYEDKSGCQHELPFPK